MKKPSKTPTIDTATVTVEDTIVTTDTEHAAIDTMADVFRQDAVEPPPAPAANPAGAHKHYCMGHHSAWYCANSKCSMPEGGTMLCDDCRQAHLAKHPEIEAALAIPSAPPVRRQATRMIETLEQKIARTQAELVQAQAQLAQLAQLQADCERRSSEEKDFAAAAGARDLGEACWAEQRTTIVQRGRSTTALTPQAPRAARQPKADDIIVQGYTLSVAVYRKANNPRWCPQVVFTKDGVSYKKTVGDTTVERSEAVSISEAAIEDMVARQEILGASERQRPGQSLRTMARQVNNTINLHSLISAAANF